MSRAHPDELSEAQDTERLFVTAKQQLRDAVTSSPSSTSWQLCRLEPTRIAANGCARSVPAERGWDRVSKRTCTSYASLPVLP
jgi:hypothetical protein